MPNRSVYLAYVYLMRIPILSWLVLMGIVAASLTGSPLLRGLFDIAPQESSGFVLFFRFWLLALSATLATASIAMTSWLVLVWGDTRFAAGTVATHSGLRRVLMAIALAPAGAVFGAALFITSNSASEFWHPWQSYFGGALGFISAFLIYLLALWARRRVYSVLIPAMILAGFMLLLVIFYWFGLIWGSASIVILVLIGYGAVRFAAAARNHVGHQGRSVTSGYLDDNGRIDSHHLLAVTMTALSLIVYIAIGQLRFFNFGRIALLPTLALVVIWVTLACYLLAGAAFFLDFFRIPLLMVLGIYSLFVAQSPEGDHFYSAMPASRPAHLGPAEVLKAGGGHSVILVSATGGGIQAAGWTAQALTGIARNMEATYPGQFARMVRLVSAVSGGSLGAMYFIEGYQPDGKLPQETVGGEPVLRRIVDAAESSSLDELTFGLIFIDQWRGLFPFGWQHAQTLDYDRGYWLENAWKRDLWPGKPYHTALPERLSDWRDRVRKGLLPAVIFNSTIAETGERFLMGTSDLECPDWESDHIHAAHGAGSCLNNPVTGGPIIEGTRQFYDEYDKVDLHPATAARLSATFPFVTAAARIDQGGCCRKQFHAVDGGYFDNYGMATLTEWLEQALHDNGLVDRVLVIQLRSSPPDQRAEPEGLKGWFFQTLAPVLTLYQARGTTQLSRNSEELYLLAQRSPKISIQTAIFSYNHTDSSGNPDNPPLSWHLTQTEKENIRQAWAGYEKKDDPAMGEVRKFFFCANHPEDGECNQ
jgi:hypothetical protein